MNLETHQQEENINTTNNLNPQIIEIGKDTNFQVNKALYDEAISLINKKSN
jgi:hypothetical protein